MIRSIAVVLKAFTLLGVAVQQPETTPDDTARRQDIYSVYSALFASPDPQHPVYLIVAKTSSLQDVSLPEFFGPKGCVTVPPAYATDWDEILAEFSARKASPGTLEAVFKSATHYRLFKENDESEARASTMGVVRLADVYFNQKRTLALTYRAIGCGSLCGTGSWIVVEKRSDGTWKTRPEWVHCIAMG